MNHEKILYFWMWVCRFNFGTFEKEEFKKFLRMGLIFAFIIGVYWTLRTLKDSIFIQLVDKMHLPYAKTISILVLLPLVMFYTKLLQQFSREKVLMLLPTFYGIAILCFGGVIAITQAPPEVIAARPMPLFLATKFLGYVWYLFVESFGSLMVALFWAFSTDTTEPTSAKKGFPLVVTIGQIGGIICPYGIAGLPQRLQLKTDTLSLIILGLISFILVLLIQYFLKITPQHLLTSFQGKEEKKNVQKEAGFLEGIKLVLAHRYLLSIFAVNFFYEFIVTIFDFNFKLAAGTAYSGVALSNYLSLYGSSVNFVSLLCLLLGISNITRFLGIWAALAAMPIIVGLALCGFLMIDSLSFLFALMVGSKAINYALNGPALKQLYIPTTTDVRFKAQAWIETFGSRASKEAASFFNMLLKPFQTIFGAAVGRAHYLTLGGIIGFPLLVLWLIIAFYLGKSYRRAIQEKATVC